jgi:competence protein ComGC
MGFVIRLIVVTVIAVLALVLVNTMFKAQDAMESQSHNTVELNQDQVLEFMEHHPDYQCRVREYRGGNNYGFKCHE